jgi:hypothetical protein
MVGPSLRTIRGGGDLRVRARSPQQHHCTQTEKSIHDGNTSSEGTLWISWTLAMQNPDGSTFEGATFTSSYPIR